VGLNKNWDIGWAHLKFSSSVYLVKKSEGIGP